MEKVVAVLAATLASSLCLYVATATATSGTWWGPAYMSAGHNDSGTYTTGYIDVEWVNRNVPDACPRPLRSSRVTEAGSAPNPTLARTADAPTPPSAASTRSRTWATQARAVTPSRAISRRRSGGVRTMSNAVRSPLRLLIGASILLTALFAAFVLRAHGSGVDATTIAPVLDRAPVASERIPQDTLAAEQRFGEALDASTSRRIAFGALSEWIVQSSSGDLCTVSTLSADPGSVRWGCSKPSADNSAFVSLSVTPLTSPAATTWRGVISGTRRGQCVLHRGNPRRRHHQHSRSERRSWVRVRRDGHEPFEHTCDD